MSPCRYPHRTHSRNSRFGLTASARAAAIPDPATGRSFPGNQIPISRLNAVTKNLLDSVIPLPTVAATGLLRYSIPATNNFRQELIKVDHNFGSKDMLSVRYFN